MYVYRLSSPWYLRSRKPLNGLASNKREEFRLLSTKMLMQSKLLRKIPKAPTSRNIAVLSSLWLLSSVIVVAFQWYISATTMTKFMLLTHEIFKMPHPIPHYRWVGPNDENSFGRTWPISIRQIWKKRLSILVFPNMEKCRFRENYSFTFHDPTDQKYK